MAETREMAANTTKFKSDGSAKLNCSPEKSNVVVVVVRAVGGREERVSEAVRTRRE